MKIDISDYAKEVTNHNADEFCVHETCSKIFTKYYELKIKDLVFYLPVCDEHEEIIDDIRWEEKYYS